MTPTQTFGTSNPVHRLTVQHCTEALWKMMQTGLRALENYGGGHLEASRLLTDQGDLLCAAGSGPGISTVRSERQVRYTTIRCRR
jgi:hypothetical protein